MWLLDANMDIHLRSVLLTKGVVAESAWYKGWTALVTGELVTEAVALARRREGKAGRSMLSFNPFVAEN